MSKSMTAITADKGEKHKSAQSRTVSTHGRVVLRPVTLAKAKKSIGTLREAGDSWDDEIRYLVENYLRDDGTWDDGYTDCIGYHLLVLSCFELGKSVEEGMNELAADYADR